MCINKFIWDKKKYWQLRCHLFLFCFYVNSLKWRSLVLNQIHALQSLKAQYYMQSKNWNLQAGSRKQSKAPNLKCNYSNHLLLLIDFTSSMDWATEMIFTIFLLPNFVQLTWDFKFYEVLWERYPRIYNDWTILEQEMNTLIEENIW